MREEYYGIRVICGNCGFKGRIKILKGCSVGRQECPKCDITSLECVDIPKEMR